MAGTLTPVQIVLTLIAGFAVGGVLWMSGVAGGPESSEPPEQAAPVAGTPEPEDAVKAVVERSFARPAPENCDEIYTERLLRWAAGTQDIDEAREDCRGTESGEYPADEIVFDSTEVGPSAATTVAAIHGGSAGGYTLTLELVADNGWKLDRVADIEVDRAEVEESGRRVLADLGLRVPRIDCLNDAVFARGTEPYERAFLANELDRLERRATERCLTRADLIELVVAGARLGLTEEVGAPPAFVRCFLEATRSVLANVPRRVLLRDEMPPAIEGRLDAVGDQCARIIGTDGKAGSGSAT